MPRVYFVRDSVQDVIDFLKGKQSKFLVFPFVFFAIIKWQRKLHWNLNIAEIVLNLSSLEILVLSYQNIYKLTNKQTNKQTNRRRPERSGIQELVT